MRMPDTPQCRRSVGSRLGQGAFTLLSVEAARPCMRCILDQDPVARKQAAKIAKYRGQYDQYGNRLTRTMINTQNIINSSDEIFNNIFTGVDSKEEDEEQHIMEEKGVDISDYNFGEQKKISLHGVMSCLVLEHPGKLRLTDYNARQCNHCSRKDMDDFDFIVNTNDKKKLDYKDRLEQDHTYTGMKGDYLQKREQ